jgi:hypothetical protein
MLQHTGKPAELNIQDPKTVKITRSNKKGKSEDVYANIGKADNINDNIIN